MTIFNHKYDNNVAVFFTRQYIRRRKLASLTYGVNEMASLFQTKSYWQSLFLTAQAQV